MIHEGERLDREIKKLERDLEQPVGTERRIELQAALLRLKQKRRDWEKPRC